MPRRDASPRQSHASSLVSASDLRAGTVVARLAAIRPVFTPAADRSPMGLAVGRRDPALDATFRWMGQPTHAAGTGWASFPTRRPLRSA